jgi:hypothetical protein
MTASLHKRLNIALATDKSIGKLNLPLFAWCRCTNLNSTAYVQNWYFVGADGYTPYKSGVSDQILELTPKAKPSISKTMHHKLENPDLPG